MPDLTLEGCRPTPLAAYLKALGVLRLLAEQADPDVRGWWAADRFHLNTKLDRDELVRFFIEDYKPTPIIAPWNGGSGFYPKDAKVGIDALRVSSPVRFEAYREAIDLGFRLITEQRLAERPTDKAKSALIASLRAEASDALVGWIDTAVALTLDRMAFPPLLGTGGNDGRLDFTNNFMQRLVELVPTDDAAPSGHAIAALNDALFAAAVPGLSSAAIGQFAPGAAGGPNSAAGFEGPARVNGWDFLLMMEGAIVFAGGVSRRLEGAGGAYLAYPFTVRATAAGFGSASLEEQGDTRGELWAPLWGRPSGYPEVRTLFREGRLSLGAKPARDGLDAARAVNALGADRRVTAFERYGFVKRQGLAYLAAPLGRREVRANATGGLLSDLDRGDWLQRLRSKAETDEASADLRQAVRKLEDSVFILLERPNAPTAVQNVLIAFGSAVREIAIRSRSHEAVPPPPELRAAWISEADDRSPEFRIAVAIAGLTARLKSASASAAADGEGGDGRSRSTFGLPMRGHLAPLDPDDRLWPIQWNTDKGAPLVVWGAGDLVDNLCRVVQRRLVEQAKRGLEDIPFHSAFDRAQRRGIAIGSRDLTAFLDRRVRDDRIADLILGLAWATPGYWSGDDSPGGYRPSAPPLAYAALKPMFTPRSEFARIGLEGLSLPLPHALPALLARGRVQAALHMAQARARASGRPTPFLQARAETRTPDLRAGRRLLAALAIPVSTGVLRACFAKAYPSSDPTHEEPNDDAA